MQTSGNLLMKFDRATEQRLGKRRRCKRWIGKRSMLGLILACWLSVDTAFAHQRQGDGQLVRQARQTLLRATAFFAESCSKQGGYVWRYSGDLSLSEGEAETSATTAWVQPPGTPTVGDAYLAAFRATGDEVYLAYAREVATALQHGQMRSGGWYYSIEFDPAERQLWGYRQNDAYQPRRSGRDRRNVTTLDDDTTTASLSFLMRLDQATGHQDPALGEAIRFALGALILAQAPNGGFAQNWDRFPVLKSTRDYPIQAASYGSWSRIWLNDWTGRYYLNDNVMSNVISTFLLAFRVYGDPRYLAAARRAGDFLILAQFPEPQPGWAQQYDTEMHAAWDRKFEPPAVTGGESQDALNSLMDLYVQTRDPRYLRPVRPALEWLKRSEVAPGTVARFYELGTNRPLYFRVEDGKYLLTYDDSTLPTHYAFKVRWNQRRLERRLAQIEDEHPEAPPQPTLTDELRQQVRLAIDSLDRRGSWTEPGNLKGFGKADRGGVIRSDTFVERVMTLARFLEAAAPKP